MNKSRKNPYYNMVKLRIKISIVKKSDRNFPIMRRQDAPVYDMNASIYIWLLNSQLFSKNLIFVISRRSMISIITLI